jgi:hypothetical protein
MLLAVHYDLLQCMRDYTHPLKLRQTVEFYRSKITCPREHNNVSAGHKVIIHGITSNWASLMTRLRFLVAGESRYVIPRHRKSSNITWE